MSISLHYHKVNLTRNTFTIYKKIMLTETILLNFFYLFAFVEKLIEKC